MTHSHEFLRIPDEKRIVLIAHDKMKPDLLRWAVENKSCLAGHELFATGTTGHLLGEALGRTVFCFESGPLGGDLQAGARITDGAVDLMVFFWDPLSAQPHDPDVKALLRVAVLWNVPMACNEATATFLLTSTLMSPGAKRRAPDFQAHRRRLSAATPVS